MSRSELAIDGSTPIRSKPMPCRGLITEEEKAAAMAVFDEAIRTGEAFGYNGSYERQYEKDFVGFMGGGFADAVNSGTNAVFCALGGLQLDALSEVVVPPITDPGGVMPVLFVGCVPVFADSDPGSYNTNAEQIERCITERTRAIIVAHIAGEPADMDPILALAEKHGLSVVEDCAQAHGALYKGRMVGGMGRISAFSTMFGKHHCTGGQGGVVYTRDEALHLQAKRFADRGKPFEILGEAGNVVGGLNCNSNDLSAAIGSAQMRRLPGIIAKRRMIGNAIKEGLKSCEAVGLGRQVPGTEPVYWFLRVGLETEKLLVGKAAFCRALAAEGIGGVVESYRFIQCENPWFRNKAIFGGNGFPWSCSDYRGDRNPDYHLENAIRVTDTHFNIQINEAYGEDEVDDLLTAVKKVEKAYLK